MRVFIIALALLVSGALTTHSYAEEAGGGQAVEQPAEEKKKKLRMPTAKGFLVSADASTVVIKGKDDTEQSFAVSESTKIRLGRDSIAVTDIKVDTPIVIKHLNNNARMILVRPAKQARGDKDKKAKKEKGADAPMPVDDAAP